MRKIGPWLQVSRKGYITNMQDAIDADTESGVAWMNDEAHERLSRVAPTILEMARLIEKERNELARQLRKLKGQKK